ncbi:hypothetical protein BGW38_006826, partial [Lunasporangiospora selenospora]
MSVQVLISGAGPVGLFQALLLARLKVPVRIIDRANGICPLSRSTGVHPRTLEIIDMVDHELLTKLVDQGNITPAV